MARIRHYSQLIGRSKLWGRDYGISQLAEAFDSDHGFISRLHEDWRLSVWAKAFYEQKREQGKDHHTAVRALAFKWIRILYRCWQDSKPYEESRYLAALERRGSPLVRDLPVSVESL